MADRIATNRERAGRAAYEADVAKTPRYHDGALRRSWDELDDLARASWIKNPTPR